MKKTKTKGFEVKFDDFEETEGQGICKGYLSRWDEIDHVNDVVVKGAYTESLQKKNPIPFLWMHNPETPIGAMTCKEDDVGLYVECKFYLSTELGREKYNLVRENNENGIKSGLSIGYSVQEREYGAFKDEPQVRFLKKINLREGSLVTWACLESAHLTDVKSLEGINIRDVEWALRDVMSNSMAKKYSSLIKSDLCDAEETDDEQPIEEEVIENGQVDETTEIEETQVEDEQEVVEDEDQKNAELASELKRLFELENLKLNLNLNMEKL